MKSLSLQIVEAGGPIYSGTMAEPVRFHDDKTLYTGVHAKGGPSTLDYNRTRVDNIQILCDRGEADVRGVPRRLVMSQDKETPNTTVSIWTTCGSVTNYPFCRWVIGRVLRSNCLTSPSVHQIRAVKAQRTQPGQVIKAQPASQVHLLNKVCKQNTKRSQVLARTFHTYSPMQVYLTAKLQVKSSLWRLIIIISGSRHQLRRVLDSLHQPSHATSLRTALPQLNPLNRTLSQHPTRSLHRHRPRREMIQSVNL